jgi:hypothetical protein
LRDIIGPHILDRKGFSSGKQREQERGHHTNISLPGGVFRRLGVDKSAHVFAKCGHLSRVCGYAKYSLSQSSESAGIILPHRAVLCSRHVSISIPICILRTHERVMG